jgi:inosine/xanthosine triphosphatase
VKFLAVCFALLSGSYAGEEMTIALGSTNPVKIGALEEVVRDYPDLAHAAVISYAVSSDVSEQPLSLEEMIRGAKTRAKKAFHASGKASYGFGIESGLFAAPGAQSGFLEASICAIYDGMNHFIGLSCGFEVPPQILELVLQKKMDLSQACHEAGVTSDPKLGAGEGLIGILTKGRIDRKKYTKQCITTALIQLENARFYSVRESESERSGLAEILKEDRNVYSVGISTGGAAEIRMASALPGRQVVATTLDEEGARFAKAKIEKAGLRDQIEVKIENVASKLPYADGFFDFIYARLVLHYLSKQDLAGALRELYRVLKVGGRMFAVVRSTECWEAKEDGALPNPLTGLTTYSAKGQSHSRFFHTPESMQKFLTDACFRIGRLKTYNERLCIDFQREVAAEREDALIELLAVK